MRLIGTVLLLAGICAAQEHPAPLIRARAELAGGIEIVWSWSAATTGVPSASFNLYQAAGACPASGVPAAGAVIALGDSLTTFTQYPAPGGVTCTWVTALSAEGIEGAPSAPYQLDLDAPGIPSTPIPMVQGSSRSSAPNKPVKPINTTFPQ